MKSIIGGMFCLAGLVFTMSAFSHFTWFKVLSAALCFIVGFALIVTDLRDNPDADRLDVADAGDLVEVIADILAD